MLVAAAAVVVVVTVLVVEGVVDDERKCSFDSLDVDSLLNERRVSGKFGGVAGVFAGVMYCNERKDLSTTRRRTRAANLHF